MPIPLDPESGSQPGMFPVVPPYAPSDEVAAVAERVLARFDELREVREAVRDGDIRLTYWFDNAGFDPVKDEITHETIGKALKAPPFWRVESGMDAAIIISSAFWAVFSTEQREATVLHELSHIEIARNKAGQPYGVRISRHSIEEFTAVIRHYGSYLPDRAAFFKAYTVWQKEQDAPASK
jgi:hypothetical protein